MNPSCKILRKFLVAAGLLLSVSNGNAYEIRVSEKDVMPGHTVQLPVLIDHAADVATIKFQINYDPQLLLLTSVSTNAGALEEGFSMQYTDEDGVLVVYMYRSEGLVGGSGELCRLHFIANAGSQLMMKSALTIAEAGLGDQMGQDLALIEPVTVQSGAVTIYPTMESDQDSDGMPDLWEFQYSEGEGVTALDAGTDSDSDGLDNLQEYVAGLNPTNYDGFYVSAIEIPAADGHPFILHWNSVTGRVYDVYWTTNLEDGFTLLQDNIQWPANSYTDEVYNAESCGFYMIDVNLPQ